MDYFYHILVLVCIYSVLAVSLDLLIGQTGILSLAHAAFCGFGAYTSALLAVEYGAPFLAGLALGMVIASLASLVISLCSIRLRLDYLAIATFSFQMIVFHCLNNWTELTRGPFGVSGIPEPSFFVSSLDENLMFLMLAAILAAMAQFVVWGISRSPYGRVLRAIRGDEWFAQAMGKNTRGFKVTVIAVSAALAASAGSVQAHYMTYIDPTSYTVMESILVASMVIIGGAGNPWGATLGALLLVCLPEALRFVGLPDSVAANVRQLIYGGALVVMLVTRPRGLFGRYVLK